MTKDELQTWMLIAFAIVLVLASYKVYALFNTPAAGSDTQTQHAQLENIIVDFLKHLDNTDISSKELFDLLVQEDDFNDDAYRNFNLNRLNQILLQLYSTFQVSSLPELITRIQNDA